MQRQVYASSDVTRTSVFVTSVTTVLPSLWSSTQARCCKAVTTTHSSAPVRLGLVKGHRTSAFRSGVILASPDLLAIAPFACSVGVSNVLGDPHTPSPLQQSACARAAACTSLTSTSLMWSLRGAVDSQESPGLARIVHLQRSLYERVILARART